MTVIGWVLEVGALGLLAWALWWDRARGRLRCRKCWYDLEGVVGFRNGHAEEAGEEEKRPSGTQPHGVCPECGKAHPTERSMRRTRRRWGWAFVALVAGVVGVVVGFTPAYRDGRLLHRAPSWMLAEMVPLVPSWTKSWPPSPSHPGYELVGRMVATTHRNSNVTGLSSSRPMTNGEIASMVRRMADGNLIVAPGSRRWVETTGEWLTGQVFRFRPDGPRGKLQYPDGSAADAALEEAFDRLERVMPRWYPRTRRVWVEGLPIRIESGFVSPRWTNFLDGPSEEAVWSVRGTDLTGQSDGFRYHFDMTGVGKAGDEVVLDLTLRLHPRHRWDREAGDPVLREERFVLRWKVAADAGDAVGFVDREDITRALVAHFATGAWDFDHQLNLDPVWLTKPMDGIGFGVRVDVFDGSTTIGHIHYTWVARDGRVVSSSAGDAAWWDGIRDTEAYNERVSRAMQNGTLWMRLSGVPEKGMTMLDVKRVWTGSVEVGVSRAGVVTERAGGGED